MCLQAHVNLHFSDFVPNRAFHENRIVEKVAESVKSRICTSAPAKLLTEMKQCGEGETAKEAIHGLWEFHGNLIQARSERGSRRLPRERSSEISKNGEGNSLSYTSA